MANNWVIERKGVYLGRHGWTLEPRWAMRFPGKDWALVELQGRFNGDPATIGSNGFRIIQKQMKEPNERREFVSVWPPDRADRRSRRPRPVCAVPGRYVVASGVEEHSAELVACGRRGVDLATDRPAWRGVIHVKGHPSPVLEDLGFVAGRGFMKRVLYREHERIAVQSGKGQPWRLQPGRTGL